MTLRLALVGCGSMGLNHARVIATGPRTDLATIIDPDETVGRAVAERYGATWAPDLDGLAEVDAAVIAAPTEHHPAGPARHRGRAAAPGREAGLPVGRRHRGGRRGLREAGTPLMCGLLERFNPAVMVAIAMRRSRCTSGPSGTRRTWTGSRPASPGTSWCTTSTWWYGPSVAAPDATTCRSGSSTRQSVAGAEDVVEARCASRRRHRAVLGAAASGSARCARWSSGSSTG